MKKTMLTGLSMMAVLFLAGCGPTPKSAAVTIFDEGLRYCESTCPYDGGILIANFGSTQLDPLNTEGRGYVVFYKDGASEVLIPADGNLSGPRGMYLRGSHLFICDVNKIVVYNLAAKDEAPRVIELPEGEAFVNDLAADGNDLYASVTNTGHIFRLDITDPAQAGTPELWLSVPGPNGLAIRDGAMYVASYSPDGEAKSEHVIYRIGDLRNPVAEPFVAVRRHRLLVRRQVALRDELGAGRPFAHRHADPHGGACGADPRPAAGRTCRHDRFRRYALCARPAEQPGGDLCRVGRGIG